MQLGELLEQAAHPAGPAHQPQQDLVLASSGMDAGSTMSLSATASISEPPKKRQRKVPGATYWYDSKPFKTANDFCSYCKPVLTSVNSAGRKIWENAVVQIRIPRKDVLVHLDCHDTRLLGWTRGADLKGETRAGLLSSRNMLAIAVES